MKRTPKEELKQHIFKAMSSYKALCENEENSERGIETLLPHRVLWIYTGWGHRKDRACAPYFRHKEYLYFRPILSTSDGRKGPHRGRGSGIRWPKGMVPHQLLGFRAG